VPANDVNELTCGLQTEEETGGRELLGRLPGAMLVAGALGLFSLDAEARRRKRKKKKRKKPTQALPPPASPPPPPPPPPPPAPVCVRCPKICETMQLVTCKPLTETEVCVCAWTTAGNGTCVNIVDGLNCDDPVDECDINADCQIGEVCIPIDDNNCCSETTGNRCFPVCTP
jgi:hypothetical protein